ncbi:MAG TPA: NAD-dependent epimerase/dehydratase family protein [Burkholderiales bacterium]|nr:NAD-dependent epimerase/dehydratase family protein [Burkholderiales bacterium]
MRILVTGAGGFIGSHLVRALLPRASHLVLADASAFAAPTGKDVTVRTGDIADGAFVKTLLEGGVDSVFPLAATLTTDAEADFGKGLRVNVLALVQMLELLRTLGQRPKVVFASSIAAFGGALPETVDDSIAQTPQTSYGTHKAIAELLLNDYSRRGFIDGRALRLPVVLTRPGAPSPSVSDRVAAIVREPLMGRDFACPFDPDTRLPVASVQRVARALLAIHDLPASAFGASRAMNLPALSVTVREMVEAVERHRGGRTVGKITFAPDPKLQAIVEGWPRRFGSALASSHGIAADASMEEVIANFLHG